MNITGTISSVTVSSKRNLGKEMQNGFVYLWSSGSRSCDPVSCQTSTIIFKTMVHIKHDRGSQDLDPGLQEKFMNPFSISFGKACIRFYEIVFWTKEGNKPLVYSSGKSIRSNILSGTPYKCGALPDTSYWKKIQTFNENLPPMLFPKL